MTNVRIPGRGGAAEMAVEMLGVRIEPLSFRYFNSVYHLLAERGHGAGTLTCGVSDAVEEGAGQP